MCDVEKSPRPYNIAKIVEASFSQAHEKFEVTVVKREYFTKSLYQILPVIK